MTIGQRIKQARKRAGMTQKQLAKELDLPYQSVGQWESGKRNPKYKTIEQICEKLDISVQDILAVPDDPEADFTRQVIDEHPDYEIGTTINGTRYFMVPKEVQFKESLNFAFNKLNEIGQQKAVERVEELAKVPEYQRQDEPKKDE